MSKRRISHPGEITIRILDLQQKKRYFLARQMLWLVSLNYAAKTYRLHIEISSNLLNL